MDLRVIQDRVLIEPSFVDQISAGGIFLGEGEMQDTGVVLAVGPGRRNKANDGYIQLGVQVGDKVLFSIEAAKRISAGRTRVLVIRESDILAIEDPVAVAEDPVAVAEDPVAT